MITGLHSFENHGLHAAALAGSDIDVLRAIDAGADINALDSMGRVAIMCAVAGERWNEVDALNDASFMTKERLNAIEAMLRHSGISLYTLNAPQSSLQGVTPLGVAAWLNAVEIVRVLLEDSAGTVAVDGMDTHGATALMYAARDGRLEVVKLLLSHGARPDFRDINHRTSIQFALAHPHPQILWLCELILRRHRWRESQTSDRCRLFQQSESHLLELVRSSIVQPFSHPPAHHHHPETNATRHLPYPNLNSPPASTVFDQVSLTRATRIILSCIDSNDLPFLYSLLFAPPPSYDAPATRYPLSVPLLVNWLDEATGWSPLHYCASVDCPNVLILDALYCAGADVALVTRDEEATVLHVLAMLARLPDRECEDEEIYETRLGGLYDFTMHLIGDLRAPLAARNKNDETCIHIAAERGMSIELLKMFLECDSTGSVRELRNARGLTALEVAKPEFRVAFGKDVEKLRCVSSLSMRTIRQSESFSSLASYPAWRCSSYGMSQSDTASFVSEKASPVDGGACYEPLVSSCPQESPEELSIVTTHRSQLIDSTSALSRRILQVFRMRMEEVFKALDELVADVNKIKGLGEAVDRAAEEKAKALGIKRVLRRQKVLGSEDSQTTAVSLLSPESAYDIPIALDKKSKKGPRSLPKSPSLLSLLLPKPDCHIHGSSTPSLPILSHASWNGLFNTSSCIRLDQTKQECQALQEKIKEIEHGFASSGHSHHGKESRLRAWIRKVVVMVTTTMTPPRILEPRDDDKSSETNVTGKCDEANDPAIEAVLRTSKVVLDAASQDLQSMEQTLKAAEEYASLANQYISRAERVMNRALKRRQDMLLGAKTPGLLLSAPHVAEPSPSSNPRGPQPSRSAASSIVSLSMTANNNDEAAADNGDEDEDTRIIRRLLLRKIEAQVAGAWDEMDRVDSWLRVTKEVIRGVKRRAYLYL
ncbi:hypothetical protein AMATHDRAFT_143442 [Amanita thiersii Skay4041]|uniref:Ankyrin n=1 Tax=Amanita thiersii Skay4041 TaxID=703135 RepID=A0A2A9NTG6_9AGAR|nr:hypothetical protein AMATHDRAFT_143442 [Amanita thiersii Skay4041]